METLTVEKVDEVNFQKVEKYLESVSKHLFLTEDGKFIKAFPMKIKDKLYCVTLEFDGVESNIVRISNVDYYIKNYGNNAKNVISNILFPPHGKNRTSISNFKAMKEKVKEVKKMIEEKLDENNRSVVTKEVEKTLVGLTVKKKEE